MVSPTGQSNFGPYSHELLSFTARKLQQKKCDAPKGYLSQARSLHMGDARMRWFKVTDNQFLWLLFLFFYFFAMESLLVRVSNHVMLIQKAQWNSYNRNFSICSDCEVLTQHMLQTVRGECESDSCLSEGVCWACMHRGSTRSSSCREGSATYLRQLLLPHK